MAAKKATKKRAPRKPKKPAEAEAQPHKLVGHLLVLKFNAARKVVALQQIEVALFRPEFKSATKKFKARTKEAVGEGFVPSVFEGQLWGKKLNEHGEIVDEGPMGPAFFVEAEFGKVEQLIGKALEDAQVAEPPTPEGGQ